MSDKPFEEARRIADQLAADGWGSPALDQLRQKLHELAPDDVRLWRTERDWALRRREMAKILTRPIIGIELRTPQEVFDIMVDRITRTLMLPPKDPKP